MEPITQLFFDLIPQDKLSKSGWWSLNCPECGDQKRRGSFLITETGGFRYKCWHSSCLYNTATGWEPGSQIGERTRELYISLGGESGHLPKTKAQIRQKLIDRYADDIRETLEMIRGVSA
jgi:hypothetical protein